MVESPEGGVLGLSSAAVVDSVVRWSSKVAENDPMIGLIRKIFFSEKNLIVNFFLELEKVGDPSILVAFGRNSLLKK